jgi:hypothetical protein
MYCGHTGVRTLSLFGPRQWWTDESGSGQSGVPSYYFTDHHLCNSIFTPVPDTTLSERQSILLGVGYDPADSEWHLIDTLMKSDLTETAQTELTTTLEWWLEHRYAAEDIAPAEEVHDILSS